MGILQLFRSDRFTSRETQPTTYDESKSTDHQPNANFYQCADIYFTDDPSEMEEIDTTWCFNSTRIDVQPLRLVHTTRITSDESTMTSAETQQSSAARPLPESTTEPLATPTAGGSDEFTGAGSRFVSNFFGILALVLFL